MSGKRRRRSRRHNSSSHPNPHAITRYRRMVRSSYRKRHRGAHHERCYRRNRSNRRRHCGTLSVPRRRRGVRIRRRIPTTKLPTRTLSAERSPSTWLIIRRRRVRRYPQIRARKNSRRVITGRRYCKSIGRAMMRARLHRAARVLRRKITAVVMVHRRRRHQHPYGGRRMKCYRTLRRTRRRMRSNCNRHLRPMTRDRLPRATPQRGCRRRGPRHCNATRRALGSTCTGTLRTRRPRHRDTPAATDGAVSRDIFPFHRCRLLLIGAFFLSSVPSPTQRCRSSYSTVPSSFHRCRLLLIGAVPLTQRCRSLYSTVPSSTQRRRLLLNGAFFHSSSPSPTGMHQLCALYGELVVCVMTSAPLEN